MDAKDVKELLRKEDPLVLEVGAHVGGDTIKFLHEFKGIKIYCFEPDLRCVEIFKRNIRDNRCVLIESAVANSDGKAVLHLSKSKHISVNKLDVNMRDFINLIRDAKQKIQQAIFKKYADSLGQASIKKCISKSKDYPWLIFDQEVNVETIKLDTFIRKHNISCIDFIWTDVQGAEKDVIEGAAVTLKITKYFYIEYGETSPYPEALTREESIALMKTHGFDLVERYSSKSKIGNLLFVNKKFT